MTPKPDSYGVSFGSVGSEPGNRWRNRRRAAIVRAHRRYLERELAKLTEMEGARDGE